MAVMGLLLVVLLLAVPAGWGQINNRPPEKGSFFLDSNADCNGPVREIYGQTVRVKGHGALQEQQGPTSCTLTLKSTSNFDHTNLLLQVVAANINDCDVQLVFYDGDPGQGTLKGYDCNTPSKPNERNFVTTGDVVSVVLERKNVINTQYDIEIVVSPLVSGNKPGYENDYGDTWGFFREKLENDIAIGIVAAAFLLVILIALLFVIICYRRYLGKNKPWEQHQLSTYQPPQSLYETKSRMSDTSSTVYMTNTSRGRAGPPQRRPEPHGRSDRYSQDGDSVFDDGASDITPKKQLVDQDRRWERQRERERERERQRGRGREAGSQNSSYVQADDDHPQDAYEERSIEPRGRHPRRVHKPPSYNEAINESDTEKSDIDDDEDDDDEVRKYETSEEESEEASSEQEEEEEEEDEEEEEEDDGNAAAPKAAPRPRRQQAPPHAGPQPAGIPPHPAYPGYPPVGYVGGYPMGPAGQFMPMMAAPPAGQPFGPGHPPPQYPGQRPPPGSAGPPQGPSQPPIYSYLVQRGYTPLDPGQGGPSSSHNTSRSQGSGLDEPDRTHLASGVDYLSR